MNHSKKSKILGTGSAVPNKVITNYDLEKIVDTSDEWIATRTGMKRRHIAEGETTATLSAKAANKALNEAGIPPEEIDLIIVATVTPEMAFPSTGCFLQDMIGAKNAAAMDISVGCSGFIYGLEMADAMIASGKSKNILLVGAETLSKILDWTDRSTCVLFADGAGAVVVGQGSQEGIIATHLASDGSKGKLLKLPAGGSRNPTSRQTVEKRMHYVKMKGNELFKPAIFAMVESANKVLEKANIGVDQVDLFVPHQANLRIIKGVAKKLNLSPDKLYINLEEYGNTSAASIPVALDEARKKGVLKEGQLVMMTAFGAGLTWGAALVRF